MSSSGILYTADGVPVRTIRVANIDPKLRKEFLEKHFNTKYGPIESFKILERNNNKFRFRKSLTTTKMNYAFVTFFKEVDAARAIEKCNEKLGKHTIRMSMAETWKQSLKIGETSKSRAGDDSFQPLTPLELLNDDCLLAIYEYLEPYEVANLSTVSLRLENFAAKNIYRKYANFELLNNDGLITLSTFQTMLNRFGEHIESISLSEFAFEDKANIWLSLNFVLRLCTNLKTLKIFNFSFKLHHMPKLCIRSDKLIAFEINRCHGITDHWHRMLKCWPNLQSITIQFNDEIVGRFMSSCRNLKSIVLIYCHEIKVQTLRRIFENNSEKMRELTLSNCTSLEGCTVLPIIVQTLPHLNAISLRFYYSNGPHNLNCLAELVQLRRLQFNCNMVSICSLLNSVGDKGLLEELDIIGGCLERDTYNVFRKFTQLHSLGICEPYSESESMLETIAAQLPKLRSFLAVRCLSLTDSSVVCIFRSCPQIERLEIVDSTRVTFAAVRQIVEILQSDHDAVNDDVAATTKTGRRPLLKFNVDSCFEVQVTDEQYDWLAQNRHLLRFEYRNNSPYLNNCDSDDDLDDDLDDYWSYDWDDD